ncbi:MAG TPA: hypothetical protein VFN67_40855 [Polyangiales bacterium]|nr:hypothetical protein [Polyangiales bacterium]
MIVGVDHVAIAVEDWDAALRCYAQLLGQPVPAELPWLGRRAVVFALSNARVVLHEGSGGLLSLALGVRDGAACVRQLAAAGMRAPALSEGLWQLEPEHSRGVQLQLVQRAALELPAANSFASDRVEALDHVVIRSAAPEQAAALYGGALGIRLALDRELAGKRMLFFRTGGVTLEVIADTTDGFYGLAYRVRNLAAVHARLTAAGFTLTELRDGRKKGTQVFSVRASTCGVPTLFIRDASRD